MSVFKRIIHPLHTIMSLIKFTGVQHAIKQKHILFVTYAIINIAITKLLITACQICDTFGKFVMSEERKLAVTNTVTRCLKKLLWCQSSLKTC